MEHHDLGALLVSAASTACAGPFVRSWLRRRQSLDHPNERSSHSIPTPRGGGLACAVGGAVGAAATWAFGNGPAASWFGASSILGSVGRADDLTGLAPLPRLGAQVAIGTMTGFRLKGGLGAAAGVAIVPAIVNAFNFMDGINGISGGTAAVWGSVVASDSDLENASRTQGAIVAGMALGFIPFNVPRASMFLGDVGSYLLGSAIAVTVLESTFANGRVSLRNGARTLSPMVLYLADTGSTMARRIVRGESVTDAHREHVYQRLVHETGWPHWAVSGLVAIGALICGLSSRSRSGLWPATLVVSLYLSSPSLARLAASRKPVNVPIASGERP